MEKIDLEIRIDKKVDISIDIDDVIDGINNSPMKKRWNYIGQIINTIELELTDLTDEQKQIIEHYLKNKLALFSNKLTT